MNNNCFRSKWVALLSLVLVVGLASCKPSKPTYRVVEVEGARIAIDSVWDQNPDLESSALVAPYKEGIDRVMNQIIGYSKITLEKRRPESPLSNLVADVLRLAATDVLGKPADIGLVNMGGIRNILPAGDITTGTIFEILPFENSLCIVTLKGEDVIKLMENIAMVKGEGVSNINLTITADGKLITALVGGKPIDKEQTYTVATIDYLADGNDGMVALMQSQTRTCPEGATLRGLLLDYIQEQTLLGNAIDASVEGRVIIK